MKDIANNRYTLDDVFYEGWQVFRDIVWKAFPIVFVCAFVVSVLSAMTLDIIPLEEWMARYERFAQDEEFALKFQIKIVQMVNGLFSSVIFLFAQLVVIKFAEASIVKRPITGGEALRAACGRYPRAIWTSLLAGLILLGLFMLLIVPGFIWSVYYTFMLYVIAITSLSGKAALDYSKSLVKGSFWRTLGFFLCIGFVTNIAQAMIALAGASLANLVPWGDGTLLQGVVDGMAAVTTIFGLSLGTVFFLNTAYIASKKALA